VILICNSQSRIHPKLRQRLLKVRYDPPNRNKDIVNLFTSITRGDLRQNSRKSETELRIWKYIHCHPSDVLSMIRDETVDFQMIISELMLLADIFHIMDDGLIRRMNMIYPIIVDSTNLHDMIETQFVQCIQEFKQKFETMIQS
jgi:hypothetical protein